MAKITLVLGGTRSGKSNFAQNMAKENKGKCAFIATCQPLDGEMKARIAKHKKSRPKHWAIFEDYQDIHELVKQIGSEFDIIILDCLTLLISNFMFAGLKENIIRNKINKTLSELKKIKAESIIVSNEVGLGIVPDNKLARDFRDIAGRINQLTAAKSDNVYFLVSRLTLED